jgi:ketosteroid isomerase-like protein
MGSVEETNKDIARRFLDILSRADVEAAADLYAEDIELWTAGTLPFSGTKDRAQALEGMPAILGLFPDGLRFEVQALTAEGERVAIEATSDGVTAGGVRYQQTYHFLMRVRDGRITAFREYMDTERARRVLVEGGPADS